MADAGASHMILLVASLLISGVASVVLINAWGGVTDTSGTLIQSRLADSETDIEFAGDPAMVPFVDDNPGSDDKITFLFVNNGQRVLDQTTLSLFIDGLPFGEGTQKDSSGVALAADYLWGPGDLIMVEITDTADGSGDEFDNYADDTSIQVTVVVESIVSGGFSGTDAKSYEVRLNV